MAEAKAKDAVALLKADHRTVEELFAQFEKASGEGRKRKLATEICTELSIHAQIEEEIFYPACEGKVEEDLLKEAYVEHDGAKVLIAEIIAGEPSDEFYDAKVKVLQEQIEHHVEEADLPVIHLRGQVSHVNRYGARKEHVLLGIARRCLGIAAHQPATEPLGVLQADAAVTEHSIILREQILVGRVVQVEV
jgi:hypothetical protein